MSMAHFKLGDAVVVKPNVKDPDLNIDLGGWQGRISEIKEKDNIICIAWDSLTLKQIPDEIIARCEEEGMDWTRIYLYSDEVERATPRDSEDDVEEAIAMLEERHVWSYLGEQGKRIQAVLDQAEELGDEWSEFEAWENYLQQVLKFPFQAEVSEWQEKGPLRTGAKVTVLEIEEIEDMYGILVSIRYGRRHYVVPLCDLEVVDKSSPNYQPVDDYATWFANR
ncbi:hypothetical protein D6779_02650 [Candidatus Parcubacteria bacterium]|nr:MAG: hypothetical protein D6779_02650 [Candidatus Parcubacteria bacterium]